MSRRRSGLTWALFVAFVVVPILEIYVLIQVGQVIGAWWTVLLLVLDSILGSWLIKREGARAGQALRVALETGRMPARELADAALILVGGTLMLSPGFVTDVFGIALILPFTRPLARRLLTQVVTRRLVAANRPRNRPRSGPGGGPADRQDPGAGSGGPVVRGEVVDE